jgi:hypothetical protein
MMEKSKKKMIDILAYNLREVLRDEPIKFEGTYDMYSAIVDYIEKYDFDEENAIKISFEFLKTEE